MIERIQNKPGGCCMWDGDPIYCQECGRETASTYTTPAGKGVCGRCAKAAFEAYTPLSCTNCNCIPQTIVKRDDKPVLCSKCDDLLYGERTPEDIFDDATAPYGGRLKLPPPKPDSECTPKELERRKLIRGLFGGLTIIEPQPILGPSDTIFTIKPRKKSEDQT